MRSELHLYDFDGTVFRSPEKPNWWSKGWWGNPISLNPPCVPEHPDTSWWVEQTVREAKSSISDPDVYAVLATGRQDHAFRWRVPELLKQKGLDFDEVHLAPGGEEGVEYFKVALLKKLLTRYPFIRKLQIWDDKLKYLTLYKTYFEKAGYEVIPHLVKAPAHDVLCDASEVAEEPTPNIKPLFSEIVLLDTKSLHHWWLQETGLPLLPRIVSHHVTIQVKPSLQEVSQLPLGQKVPVKVLGWAADQKAQVVVVDVGPFTRTDSVSHITVALNEGASPAYSNELLKHGWQRFAGPVLTGLVGFNDGKSDYFSLSSSTVRVAGQWLTRVAAETEKPKEEEKEGKGGQKSKGEEFWTAMEKLNVLAPSPSTGKKIKVISLKDYLYGKKQHSQPQFASKAKATVRKEYMNWVKQQQKSKEQGPDSELSNVKPHELQELGVRKKFFTGLEQHVSKKIPEPAKLVGKVLKTWAGEWLSAGIGATKLLGGLVGLGTHKQITPVERSNLISKSVGLFFGKAAGQVVVDSIGEGPLSEMTNTILEKSTEKLLSKKMPGGESTEKENKKPEKEEFEKAEGPEESEEEFEKKWAKVKNKALEDYSQKMGSALQDAFKALASGDIDPDILKAALKKHGGKSQKKTAASLRALAERFLAKQNDTVPF